MTKCPYTLDTSVVCKAKVELTSSNSDPLLAHTGAYPMGSHIISQIPNLTGVIDGYSFTSGY